MNKMEKLMSRIFSLLIFISSVAAVIFMIIGLNDAISNQTKIHIDNRIIDTQSAYTEEDVHTLGDLMYAGTKGRLEGVLEEDAKRAMKLWGQVAINLTKVYKCSIEELATNKYIYGFAASKIGNIDTPEKVYDWAEELLKDGDYAPSNLLYSRYFKSNSREEYDHIGEIYFYLETYTETLVNLYGTKFTVCLEL